jgi:hypothetical protein
VFGHPARSLEFHHLRFFEKPQHRGAESQVSDTSKSATPSAKQKATIKIAAIVDDVGNNGEGSA